MLLSSLSGRGFSFSVRTAVRPLRNSTLELLEEAGWLRLWHPSGAAYQVSVTA